MMAFSVTFLQSSHFTYPCEISLHQWPDAQLAAVLPLLCGKFLQLFFFPVNCLDHGQRKVYEAVFLLCLWQCLYGLVKPAPCMRPAPGNLQVFPLIFKRVVDLVPVCDAYPAEIFQELPLKCYTNVVTGVANKI